MPTRGVGRVGSGLVCMEGGLAARDDRGQPETPEGTVPGGATTALLSPDSDFSGVSHLAPLFPRTSHPAVRLSLPYLKHISLLYVKI